MPDPSSAPATRPAEVTATAMGFRVRFCTWCKQIDIRGPRRATDVFALIVVGKNILAVLERQNHDRPGRHLRALRRRSQKWAHDQWEHHAMTRGAKSNTTVGGHRLTYAELTVLNQLRDYMIANAGDSTWNSLTSPKGDGRSIPLREIFPEHSPANNAKRHTARHLYDLGVLAALCIELRDGLVRGSAVHLDLGRRP